MERLYHPPVYCHQLGGVESEDSSMSEIDRNLKGSRNNFRGRLLVTLIASAIVASLMMTMLITPAPSEGNPPAPNVPARVSYNIHAPISINGNAAFATKALAETWPGDGSIGNPYIIQGYDINASSAHGIFIQNTDVYFIVRDCYVHDGGLNSEGIFLFSCVHGTVTDNICTNNYDGIFLGWNSINNTLSNNTCSSNNQIDMYGIYIEQSNDNILINNTCSNNDVGIDISNSCNNTLSNNNCSLNNQYGIWLDSSVSFDLYANDNTLNNNTCSSNNLDGIYLNSSSYNILIDNTCSNNNGNFHCGIVLNSSSSNTLINNNCSNNANGIGCQSSSNNILINNSCDSEITAGIILYASSNNNTLINNSCSNNGEGAIILLSSNNNTLINNICSNNWFGIYLATSSDNTLNNNTCSNNGEFGIDLEGSSGNGLSMNQMCNNTGYGVYIWSGSSNRIWNNTFIGNNGAGSVYDPSHVQASDDGTNNRWNTSGSPHGYGNYWGDWQGRDFNMDGIQDAPYNITGFLGAKDFYPLATFATPIPEFSELIVPIVGLMMIALIFGRTRKKL